MVRGHSDLAPTLTSENASRNCSLASASVAVAGTIIILLAPTLVSLSNELLKETDSMTAERPRGLWGLKEIPPRRPVPAQSFRGSGAEGGTQGPTGSMKIPLRRKPADQAHLRGGSCSRIALFFFFFCKNTKELCCTCKVLSRLQRRLRPALARVHDPYRQRASSPLPSKFASKPQLAQQLSFQNFFLPFKLFLIVQFSAIKYMPEVIQSPALTISRTFTSSSIGTLCLVNNNSVPCP